MQQTFLSLALALITLFFSFSCTHRTSGGSATPEAEVAGVGDDYVALEFSQGSSSLTEPNQRELNKLALKAQQDGREISDIKILAWADKEYAESVQRGSPRDVILARERANSIKEFLQDELHTQSGIEAFNMAKKPNLLSELTKGEDWKLKEAFKEDQASVSRLPSGSYSYTKASKALVIIDYKDDQN